MGDPEVWRLLVAQKKKTIATLQRSVDNLERRIAEAESHG